MTNLKLKLLIILFSSTSALADLPPDMQAERYSLQMEKALKAEDIDYNKAARLMDKIIVLKDNPKLQLPKELYFKYAKILLESSEDGKGNKAWTAINKYLLAIDRKNKNYVEALDLYQQALNWRSAEAKTINELQHLLDLGADVHAKDDNGMTPLDYAYKYNKSPAVIKALIIAAGVDVHAKDSNGNTPLYFVVYKNKNPETIKAFIAAGAKVNVKDEDGWTPLHVAAVGNENPEIIKVLITAGADVNAKSDNGYVPLHLAARHNINPAITKALIAAEAKVNAKDEDGRTPLYYAYGYKESPEIIEALIAAGGKR